jgi:hypothetical protein
LEVVIPEISRFSQGGSVAKRLSMEQSKQLAARGARARIAELRAEIAAITRAFPDVAESAVAAVTGRRRRRRRAAAPPAGSVANQRPKLSAKARAAISAARKKRWAAIKRKKAAGESQFSLGRTRGAVTASTPAGGFASVQARGEEEGRCRSI